MKYLIIVAILFSLSACSIFQTEQHEESVDGKKEDIDEVYVFDDIPESEVQSSKIKDLEKDLDKTLNKNKVDSTSETDAFGEPISATTIDKKQEGEAFYLQLGAFSNLKNAEHFVSEIKSQVPFELSIIYNSITSLYNVRSSAYTSKASAEKVRNDFWSKNLFKDAFIVSQ